MKFTFDWLKEHIRTDLTHTEVAEKLTELGIEVEEVVDNKQKFANFVVGHIDEAEKHPNADRLRVCKVNIGDKRLQIVCGAPNARAGIYVAVALVGAIIPVHGEALKKGKIRGVESQGMMCSARELMLGDESDGIIELPNTVVPGQDLASALSLDDVIFDVSLTPNRADCFSVRGIARDLAAIGAGDLLELDACEIPENIENPVDVELETPACDYFSTLAIMNVIGKTPDCIARRLRAIGQNLVSLPVDIANYACLDIGQPLHIYDLDKVPQRLVVRNSRDGETLETLNNKQTILPEGAVVVANGDEILSIAGIMGGIKSGFCNDTRNILVESAYFDKVAIAKAGQKLRINSDSRTRFERGTDPENVDLALRYVAKLLGKCCDCKFSNIARYGKLPENKHTIELTFEKFNALTGLSSDVFEKSKDGLVKLGMNIKSINSERMVVETPSWRHDLEIEEDIIEEILRLYGYENIVETELPIVEPSTRHYTSDTLSDALVYNGYYEVKTFSFIDRKTAEMFANAGELIDLQDASAEFSTLRPTLVASQLKAIKNAQNKSQRNSKFFEIGRSFKNEDGKVTEQTVLIAAMSEKVTARNWRKPQENVSVFDAKADLERLLNMLGLNYRLKVEAPAYYHPGRSGTFIFQKDTVLAHFGEIHPTILSQLEIAAPVVCFELFLDNVPEFFDAKVKKPLVLSQYQPTTRDFSFIVKKTVPASDIITAIQKQHIEEIKEVKIFDVYESEAIGIENKAIALEILLQSDKETLSDEKISAISEKVVSAVSKNCKGTLRDCSLKTA